MDFMPVASRKRSLPREMSVQFLIKVDDVTKEVEAALLGLSDIDRAQEAGRSDKDY